MLLFTLIRNGHRRQARDAWANRLASKALREPGPRVVPVVSQLVHLSDAYMSLSALRNGHTPCASRYESLCCLTKKETVSNRLWISLHFLAFSARRFAQQFGNRSVSSYGLTSDTSQGYTKSTMVRRHRIGSVCQRHVDLCVIRGVAIHSNIVQTRTDPLR